MSRIAKPGQLIAVPEPRRRPVRSRQPYGRLFMRNMSAFIQAQPANLIIAAALLLIVAVSLLDYATGTQISFLPFYMLPVALVTWYVGRRAGLLVTALSMAAWMIAYAAVAPLHLNTPDAYWNLIIRSGVFLIVAVGLAEMKRALDSEKDLARTDTITGAGNSRAFNERIEQTILNASRYKHAFTGAYIDVDNFKAVNDHYGHSTGDFCLRVIVDIIRRNTRNTDFVARLGGDEFAILMPETNVEQARIVISRLREMLLEAMQHNGWPATFSIGVVTYNVPPDNADDFIKTADALMYSVKNNGKNAISYQECGKLPPTAEQSRRVAS